MKEVLLDTDILSYYLKGDAVVIERVVEYLNNYPSLNISSITYYEVLKGLEYKDAPRQIANFEDFIKACKLINIDKGSLKISAKIHGKLKQQGRIIGTSDILIAGIAIQGEFQLISNNLKHFENIENMDVVSWKR